MRTRASEQMSMGPQWVPKVFGGMLGVVLLMGMIGRADAEHAGPTGRPALDPALASYEQGVQVSGTVIVKGSNTMQPLVARLASEFHRRHPGADIEVEGGGSEMGLKEFLENNVQAKRVAGNGSRPVLLVASSRELTAAEIKQSTDKHGYEPTAVPVAVDAVAIYVHRDNPLSRLRLDQVDAVFSTTRKRGYPYEIKKWGQLGLNNGWENAQIKLYGRDHKSGTRAFIKEHVLGNGEFDPAVQEEPGAASVILALSRDPFGMAYSGIGLQNSSVSALPLADKEDMPFITPDTTSVMDGSYPLRRLLYFYVDKSPHVALQPVLRQFLAFANSREGQQSVVKVALYPLPIKQVQQNLAALTPTRVSLK